MSAWLELIINDSVVRLVYVLKLEMAPTVGEFYFYKPKSEWFLGNILITDELKLLHSMK
jgi:hypothetical protein